jgi:hypothetical protein
LITESHSTGSIEPVRLNTGRTISCSKLTSRRYITY